MAAARLACVEHRFQYSRRAGIISTNLALGVELGDLRSAVASDKMALVCFELASVKLGARQRVSLSGVTYEKR
jgi:hypothetical protein